MRVQEAHDIQSRARYGPCGGLESWARTSLSKRRGSALLAGFKAETEDRCRLPDERPGPRGFASEKGSVGESKLALWNASSDFS